MAKAMLGLWEEAVRDLHMARKFDLDEEATVMLKKVICIIQQCFCLVYEGENSVKTVLLVTFSG